MPDSIGMSSLRERHSSARPRGHPRRSAAGCPSGRRTGEPDRPSRPGRAVAVDPAGLMPFGADHVKAAGLAHAGFLLFHRVVLRLHPGNGLAQGLDLRVFGVLSGGGDALFQLDHRGLDRPRPSPDHANGRGLDGVVGEGQDKGLAAAGSVRAAASANRRCRTALERQRGLWSSSGFTRRPSNTSRNQTGHKCCCRPG